MLTERKHVLIFCAIIATYVIPRFLFLFGTHYGFDDMHYARLGYELSLGNPLNAGDHYTFRWLYIGPLALFYKIFGVNDFSSGLLSMISLILTCFLLLKSIDEEQSPWYKILLALLLCATPWIGFYSDKIMTDVPTMMAVFMAFYGLYSYYFSMYTKNKSAALFIGGLVIGFLIKESIVIVLPAMALLFGYDLWEKRKLDLFWIRAAVLAFSFAIVYFAVCGLFFGHPLARVISINANGYLSDCSYDQLPKAATWQRIGKELWNRMLDGSMLLWLPWLVFAIGSNKKAKFWAVVSVLLLLSANFMTTSLTHYIPLCPDVRHYLWCVPALLALVGQTDLEKVDKKLILVGAIISFLLVLWSWKRGSNSLTSYSILFIAMLLQNRIKYAMATAMLLIVVFLTYRSYTESLPFNYDTQKVFLKKHLPTLQVSKPLIISNSAEINIDRYILGFDTTMCTFVKEQDIDSLTVSKSKNAYYILNGMTSHLSGVGWEDHPSWLRNNLNRFRRIDSTDNVVWYEINF